VTSVYLVMKATTTQQRNSELLLWINDSSIATDWKNKAARVRAVWCYRQL